MGNKHGRKWGRKKTNQRHCPYLFFHMRYVLCTNTQLNNFDYAVRIHTENVQRFSPSFKIYTVFLSTFVVVFFSSDFGIAYHTDMFYACWAEEHITTCDVVYSRENNSFGIWACISMTKYQIWSSALQTILRSHISSRILFCNEKKKCPKYN